MVTADRSLRVGRVRPPPINGGRHPLHKGSSSLGDRPADRRTVIDLCFHAATTTLSQHSLVKKEAVSGHSQLELIVEDFAVD